MRLIKEVLLVIPILDPLLPIALRIACLPIESAEADNRKQEEKPRRLEQPPIP